MRQIIGFIIAGAFSLAFPLAATANTAATGSAEANASGSIYNHANQYNNLFGGYLPQTKFTLDSVTCPTAQLTMGALPNYTHHNLGHQDGVSAVIGLNMPVDFNGTMKRCRQQQKALLTRIRTDQEFAILSVCKNAAESGIYLDPAVFAWAEYCKGVHIVGPTLASSEVDELRRQNAVLRREADKMLRAMGK